MSSSAHQELVERFTQFYQDYYRQELGELAQEYPEQRSLEIDWEDLFQYDPDIAEDFIKHPDQLREYAEEALRIYELPVDISLGGAHARIENLPERTPLSEIRSQDVNTLIKIYGTIDSISPVESRPQELAFECQRCGTLTYIPQTGTIQEPHECQGCERQGPFVVNQNQSEYVDGQTIRVQERLTGVGTEEDIESIVVHLEDDLVGETEPGDDIFVTGILRLEDQGEYNDGSISDKYIDTISIGSADPFEHISFDEEDKQAIVELANSKDLVERIVNSIAPSVHGHEEIKLAIALQLFSGVPKELPDGTKIRGDIHVLALGDPGMAKSVLLRRASQLAPRAVKASGKETTAVGLTAAAAPSKKSTAADPWSIEGGVLVLANHGLACLDDFTNLPSDAYQSLHGVLEEQEIDLSKATRTKTLPAKTSVLAAGAPKYGRFDEYEPIAEQLDVTPGLLSQFDLIFAIADHPDEEEDRELAQHMLMTNYVGEWNTQREELQSSGNQEPEFDPNEIEPEIKTELFRKYIAYSKRNCYPTISEEARETIREFYIELRSGQDDKSRSIPVTARKLEGLVRLAEASARMRLSDTVEQEDAERVIELVGSSLRDIGVEAESDEKESGDTLSVAGEIDPDTDQMEELISEIEREYQEGAPITEVLSRAEKIGFGSDKAERLIEKLKQRGELYQPSADHLRTT